MHGRLDRATMFQPNVSYSMSDLILLHIYFRYKLRDKNIARIYFRLIQSAYASVIIIKHLFFVISYVIGSTSDSCKVPSRRGHETGWANGKGIYFWNIFITATCRKRHLFYLSYTRSNCISNVHPPLFLFFLANPVKLVVIFCTKIIVAPGFPQSTSQL